MLPPDTLHHVSLGLWCLAAPVAACILGLDHLADIPLLDSGLDAPALVAILIHDLRAAAGMPPPDRQEPPARAAAAAALGVHEQTVAARLRAVEERTGRSVAARRAELETALRLREYLG